MATNVTWKEYYSVGDNSLDDEHKRIISMINELYVVLDSASELGALKEVMDRLMEYTTTHLRHEEQVMQECGYPELPAHRALHDRLRRNAPQLRENTDLVTARDMLRYLKDWWLEHIQGEDKKYTPFLS